MQEDHLQLLMNILNRCVKESIHFNTYFKEMSGIPSEVIVKQDRFEREAQDYGIYSFGEFYESGLFKKSHKLEDRNIICDTTI